MFWAFVALVPVLIAWSFVNRWRERRLARFMVRENWGDLAGTVSRRARFHKGVLLLLALTLSVVAAARPWLGTHERELKARGINMIVAVDVSLSMAARDVGSITRQGRQVEMTRLEYAGQLLRQILIEIPGHRVGIMPFAGDAFLQCPLTTDYGVVLDVVQNLDFDVIDMPGSDFERLMNAAVAAFERSGDGTRILLLMTDGEDHSGRVSQIIRTARDKGITIYALGIGSREGAPILLPDGRYIEDSNGIKVTTRMVDSTIRELAEQTGGRAYVAASGGRLDPTPLIADLNAIEREDLGAEKRVVRHERFQWPLALALLCLAIESVIGERRRLNLRREAAK
jgi:Ca-activated chloride channel family protein